MSIDKEGVPYVKRCAECGEKFKTRFEDVEYCSSMCFLKAKARQKKKERKAAVPPSPTPKLERKCPHCGKAFEVPDERPQMRYCSEECKKKARYRRKKAKAKAKAIQAQVAEIQRRAVEREAQERAQCADGWEKPAPHRKRFVKVCPDCGLTFRTVNPDKVYCEGCLAERKRNAKFADGEAVTVICERCGDEFRTYDVTMTICPECRACSPHSENPSALRKCHDCGRLTTQYRCEACWLKWKRKYRIPLDVEE